MKIGLFFGSFNPLTLAHIDIAEKSRDFVDEVWFVVSPQNPTKKIEDLCDEHHRLNMVRLACKDLTNIIDSDIEFNLEKPNYTYKTLLSLPKGNEYVIIMGSDCLNSINTWDNWMDIIKYPIICHLRDNQKIHKYLYDMMKTKLIDVTFLKSDSIISSTTVRKMIKSNMNISGLVSSPIETYIQINKLYES